VGLVGVQILLILLQNQGSGDIVKPSAIANPILLSPKLIPKIFSPSSTQPMITQTVNYYLFGRKCSNHFQRGTKLKRPSLAS